MEPTELVEHEQTPRLTTMNRKEIKEKFQRRQEIKGFTNLLKATKVNPSIGHQLNNKYIKTVQKRHLESTKRRNHLHYPGNISEK
ncbi:uncharacterized protein G2W53_035216 [Senna tora]|uniref:Uncharacterized protein n=1 Tax=Senna tora TaxID=362788 RepID=A0A834W4Q1_9FABA|nr:uncharacterized protein G2W53_035216 [Senna tora]